MANVKETPFTHNGKQYIIKVFECPEAYRVQAFLDDKPVFKWWYSMNFAGEGAVDRVEFFQKYGEPYEALIDVVKSDIKQIF